ncbi:uncharacterized protein RAG0_15733 [Rhynchosporium agropyri]|uniref:Uncharacterized protein n=1 Tax=Rhynchosporium agropyri TaxID=914238 RepID=A0A1E1LMD2_9HELO|nr:uncharacterized protein RAG0_15733 [Rhynchosporium agropyri]
MFIRTRFQANRISARGLEPLMCSPTGLPMTFWLFVTSEYGAGFYIAQLALQVMQ